jgi:hypothetical protein
MLSDLISGIGHIVIFNSELRSCHMILVFQKFKAISCEMVETVITHAMDYLI